MLIHSLFYVPTISITNSIAFANLKDPQKEFGPVRLGGTIGWIAAGWPFVFILADWNQVPSLAEVGFVDWLGKILGSSFDMKDPQRSWLNSTVRDSSSSPRALARCILAAFSLTLPHTPPKPAQSEEQRLAWLEALKLLQAVPV